jgi:hypothetical protein
MITTHNRMPMQAPARTDVARTSTQSQAGTRTRIIRSSPRSQPDARSRITAPTRIHERTP